MLKDLLALFVIAGVAMIGLVVSAYVVRRYQVRAQRDLWNRFGLRPDPPEPKVTLVVIVKTLVATVLSGTKGLTTWVGTYHGFAVQLINGLSARIGGTQSGIDRDLMRARITITQRGPTIDHFTAEAWRLELATPAPFLMQVIDRVLVESPRRARKTSRHVEEVYAYHHVPQHAAVSRETPSSTRASSCTAIDPRPRGLCSPDPMFAGSCSRSRMSTWRSVLVQCACITPLRRAAIS